MKSKIVGCIGGRSSNFASGGFGGGFGGGDCDCGKEIAANYVWLKPLCLHFKQTVPGALFLTDCFVYLDVLIGGGLLCKPGVDKVSQAADEAARLKRLMGALRYLFRNSDLTNLSFLACLGECGEPHVDINFVCQCVGWLWVRWGCGGFGGRLGGGLGGGFGGGAPMDIYLLNRDLGMLAALR